MIDPEVEEDEVILIYNMAALVKRKKFATKLPKPPCYIENFGNVACSTLSTFISIILTN